MVIGVRRYMSRRRSGHTTTVTIDVERFSITANQRDDGSLGEVFIHWGKHGTSGAGLVSMYATALSMGLLHHVPLADLIGPGLDQFFVPNGHTDDPEIPRVRSAVDYIARRLAIDWLPYPDRTALGVYTLTERVQIASAWLAAQDPSGPSRVPSRTGPSGLAGCRTRRLPVLYPHVRLDVATAVLVPVDVQDTEPAGDDVLAGRRKNHASPALPLAHGAGHSLGRRRGGDDLSAQPPVGPQPTDRVEHRRRASTTRMCR
jgi:hypothetical protein